jgi:S-DNA-T family DNA segregation ATPase FtsK/SpoIIIE
MFTPSIAAPTKARDAAPRSPGTKPKLLHARRVSELVGFLLSVAGLLLLLSLGSYVPHDPSLNTSTGAGSSVHNWVGPAGSFTADILFQMLGWVAYLVPVVLFFAGIQLLLVQPLEAPRTKAIGAALLASSLAALLELFPYIPPVGGLIRGGGLVGYLLATGFVRTFNQVGAVIVGGTLFLSSLFLVTRFSFSAALEFAKVRLIFLKALVVRWNSWREARRREYLKREVERARVVGKQPVIVQRPAKPALPVLRPGEVMTQQAAVASSVPARPAVMVLPPPSISLGGPQLPKTEARPWGPQALSRPTSAEPRSAPLMERATPPPVGPIVHAQGLEVPPANSLARTAPKIVGHGPHVYKLPSATLLRPPQDQHGIDEDELKDRAAGLTEKFSEFGVMGAVTQIHPGPVVTTYEFKPEAGIKYSRITNLVDDLCLAMKAESILIDRIPGKSTVGIEVPNLHREIIHLRELVESSEFAALPSKLALCLGKDITGKMRIGDLAQMPHLLIAGSTGSGKSVAINSMIVSILYKSTPEEVKLILIDPKRLELGLYDGVPHLLAPIVTEPKQAANVLRRATLEMELRLKKLAAQGVRNIEQYNRIFEPDSTLNLFDTAGERERPLPYIVIVIDELADLMMVEPQGVEESITRLAQMARAVGIHLILATQRPSVDVITGLIKANLPSRISFRVASKVDSRTILDANGSEALLGRGDMLFLPPGSARLVRLHGPLVTEKEIGKVVDWWKTQSQPQYDEELLKPIRDKDRAPEPDDEEEDTAELDAVYEEAVRLVVESGKASTSLLQRRLRLGYGRAARLIDMMEKDGIVSAPDGAKPREVLKRPDWLREVDSSLR